MTREEADKFIIKRTMSGSFGDFYVSDVDNLINEIFDDFESRICKNCRYLNVHPYAVGLEDCTLVNMRYAETVPLNFGCTLFESKDD